MQPPKNTKEVKRLVGRVAVLNRFISWVIDKCFPIFPLLKKAFSWDEKCDKAFQDLKAHLDRLLLINQLKKCEVLYIYLSVSRMAVSSILVREEDGMQMPVYYTSQAFRGAEERYPKAEKIAFTLVITTR